MTQLRVVIPNFAVPDSFVDNVAETLRFMGHDVLTSTLRPPGNALRLLNEIRSKAFPTTWTAAEKWVVRQARDTRVDLVLCLTQALQEEVLVELKREGVGAIAAWWGDTPANMRGFGLLADGWDGIFLKDSAAVAKFRTVGLPAEYLPEAMNPLWHLPCFTRIGDEVAVVGSAYGYRQFLVERLSGAGVPIGLYGPTPPRWTKLNVARLHRGRYIIKQEKSRIFGEAVACLNSTALSEGNSLNCRAFEIAGACGLQLIEEKPAVADCFEPGRELLVFRSIEDVVDHVARAKREPTWALGVREAGHRRANGEHTYALRLHRILSRLGL